MNNNHSILCVTASGCLESDSEVRNDKSGNKYIQFKMVCSTKDMAGQTLYIPFRCFTYNVKYAKLKKGDIVFVAGEFMCSKLNDKLNFDLYVHQICLGGVKI